MLVHHSIVERENAWLASYAEHSAASTGRRYPEKPHPYRGPFQRDRDRILHCAAFRRLSQKTQVFTGHQLGDYHRTRLTHTLEGTSIARTIGRVLRLNEDLIEALMLMHDLGHPPFGHAGEDALNECLAKHGGFNHNAQSLRIVEELEHRAPQHHGLNLCFETLAGQQARVNKTTGMASVSLEIQVVDAADSIAYDSHDPDDALHYKFIELRDLDEVPMWQEARVRVQKHFTALSDIELRKAIVHELIDWQVGDLIVQTEKNIAAHKIKTPTDVKQHPKLVAKSTELTEFVWGLEKFLSQRVYQHPQLVSLRHECQAKLQQLFHIYQSHPEKLPAAFKASAKAHGMERTIVDYISGMTDRFAMQEFERQTAAK